MLSTIRPFLGALCTKHVSLAGESRRAGYGCVVLLPSSSTMTIIFGALYSPSLLKQGGTPLLLVSRRDCDKNKLCGLGRTAPACEEAAL